MLPLIVTLLALPANLPRAVEVRLPSAVALVEAARGSDEVELERVGRRLGPSRLARIARSGKRAERLAALRALPLVDESWAELGAVALLLDEREPELAEAAARAARRIADGLTPEAIYRDEIPIDGIVAAAHALVETAARRELGSKVRASAVQAAGTLARLGPATLTAAIDPAFAQLSTDGEAVVRRAAIEALDGRAAPALLEGALGDLDPEVAAAAGASLCAVPARAAVRPAKESEAATLGEPSRLRVRALVVDEHLAVAERLDLIPCLRAFATTGDQKLLDKLARSRVDAVKRRARASGGR